MGFLNINKVVFSSFHLFILRRLVVVLVHHLVRHIHPICRHILWLSRVQRLRDIASTEGVGTHRAGALACRIVRGRPALIEVAPHRALPGIVTGASHCVDVLLEGGRLAPLPVRRRE